MTRKLTPAQLDEIEAGAKRATRGPWRKSGTWIDAGKYDEVLCPGEVSCMSYCYGGSSTIDGDNFDADIAHIVNMDPTTTLALIAEVRELRAKVERVRRLHRRTPIYETCVKDGCENAHCFETVVGDYAHDDDLVGHVCYDCSDLSDEEPIYWPCDTIKALGEEA